MRRGPGSRARRAVFFSSRRRHTRWSRDWSSDVCSSDLYAGCPATPLVPQKVVLFDTLDPVVNPNHCLTPDPVDSRYDELCVGPHQDCDGIQHDRFDGFGRLTDRHYTELCTVGGAYVCDGDEWYKYGATPQGAALVPL